MSHPSQQAPFGGSVDSYRAYDCTDFAAVNPAHAAILADTGQLAEGWYDVTYLVGCTVNHYSIMMQHRDAANTGNIDRINTPVAAYIPVVLTLKNIYLAANERFRIYVNNAVVGTVVSNIYWVRRADP